MALSEPYKAILELIASFVVNLWTIREGLEIGAPLDTLIGGSLIGRGKQCSWGHWVDRISGNIDRRLDSSERAQKVQNAEQSE